MGAAIGNLLGSLGGKITLCTLVLFGFLGMRKVARVAFAVSLLFSMMAVAALCKILAFLPLLSKPLKEALALRMVKTAWMFAITASPWIRTKTVGNSAQMWQQFVSDHFTLGGKSGRPSFILSNHASFFDTLMTVALIPYPVVGSIRCYMGAHLFKLPVLSAICRACGHFPVHFTATEEGKFSVDKVRMAKVDLDVNAHLENGGHLALFPEGQMNKNPDKLLSFRYGAFKKALLFDARLWAFVHSNHQQTWPRKVQVGGFPARTRWSMAPLAPNGCKALLKELRAKDTANTDPDYKVLAEAVQSRMQAQYDGLAAGSKED